ncbi:hypothetical protein NL533_31425, partial [Klebsiella pneumoniae]|nr:hypothetical protein [Klebsiella pneumoniae]
IGTDVDFQAVGIILEHHVIVFVFFAPHGPDVVGITGDANQGQHAVGGINPLMVDFNRVVLLVFRLRAEAQEQENQEQT